MARTHPRPRRYIKPDRVWRLKLLGFHYAHWRGEYVLRVIGDRFGPVYRVTPPPSPAGGRHRANPTDFGAAALPQSPAAADSRF